MLIYTRADPSVSQSHQASLSSSPDPLAMEPIVPETLFPQKPHLQNAKATGLPQPPQHALEAVDRLNVEFSEECARYASKYV